MSDELYVARIIEDATGKVVRESRVTSRSRAERMEDGMSINLDHEHYSTDVVPESESHWPEMRMGIKKGRP